MQEQVRERGGILAEHKKGGRYQRDQGRDQRPEMLLCCRTVSNGQERDREPQDADQSVEQ